MKGPLKFRAVEAYKLLASHITIAKLQAHYLANNPPTPTKNHLQEYAHPPSPPPPHFDQKKKEYGL